MNPDELALRLEINDAKTEECLRHLSKTHKIPFDILKNVYDFCVKYPEIKDIAKDETARKVWARKFEKNEDIKEAVEIIKQE